nr:MAG: E3 14.7 protein [unidentified adenovirus]
MDQPSNDDGAFLAATMQLSIERKNKYLQKLKEQHYCSKGSTCPVKFCSLFYTTNIETHTIYFIIPAYKEESTIIRNTDEMKLASTFLGVEGSIVCPCKYDCSEHAIQTICNLCSK